MKRPLFPAKRAEVRREKARVFVQDLAVVKGLDVQ